jgi:hypothetical protein
LDAAVVQSFAVARLAHHPARAAQELYCVAQAAADMRCAQVVCSL